MVLLGNRLRRLTGTSTLTGLRSRRNGTCSACRRSIACIIAAVRNSVTVALYSCAFLRTASESSIKVVRCTKPSGSVSPLSV